MKRLLIFLLLCCEMKAQSTMPPSPLPPFIAVAGASYGAATPHQAAPWVSFGLQVGGISANAYSFTTFDIFPATKKTPEAESIRTGAAYMAWKNKKGTFLFAGSFDAGATNTPSATVGSFSGGPLAIWKLSKFLIIGRLRTIAVVGAPIRLVPEIGIGWAP
jgi:hypothetical protein